VVPFKYIPPSHTPHATAGIPITHAIVHKTNFIVNPEQKIKPPETFRVVGVLQQLNELRGLFNVFTTLQPTRLECLSSHGRVQRVVKPHGAIGHHGVYYNASFENCHPIILGDK